MLPHCTCHCLGWVFSPVNEEEMETIWHTIFFLLKSPHKRTNTCCIMKSFPLVLPQALSFTLYFSVSLFLPVFVFPSLCFHFFTCMFSQLFRPVPKRITFNRGLAVKLEFFYLFFKTLLMIHLLGTECTSPHHWEWGAGGASAGRHFPAHS